jgi:nucleoside-diphosphate-sugar epimerase
MAKKVFVTGVAGFIGGSIAERFVRAGYEVSGLTRQNDNVAKLKAIGVEAVVGDLSDRKLLTQEAVRADIVIDAADSDNNEAVQTLLDALAGTNKVFIHTSGSSIVSDRAGGKKGDSIYDESIYDAASEQGRAFKPDAGKQSRVNLDKLILQAAEKNIRTAVICPCLIYGRGRGIKPESQQIPAIAAEALASGTSKYIGAGENLWSTVHIDDLADLYLLVAENLEGGGHFYFAENGETNFKDLAASIADTLGQKAPESWTSEAASKVYGEGAAVYAHGANSRIRGVKSRALGWKPSHANVLDDAARTAKHLAGQS